MFLSMLLFPCLASFNLYKMLGEIGVAKSDTTRNRLEKIRIRAGEFDFRVGLKFTPNNRVIFGLTRNARTRPAYFNIYDAIRN